MPLIYSLRRPNDLTVGSVRSITDYSGVLDRGIEAFAKFTEINDMGN